MKLVILVALVIAAVTAEESQILKNFQVGQAKFAADVYKELLKVEDSNFVVSPLSVDIVLALVNEGAQGNTAQQITTALHLPENKDEVHQIFRELTPHLKGNDEYSLFSANKVYLQNGFAIDDEFQTTAVNVYSAEIQNIEFGNSYDATNEMNKWVEEKTDHKIKNLIGERDVDARTRAVLINALYFQGKWKSAFKAASTLHRGFHVNTIEQVGTALMQQTAHFNYYHSSELKAKFLEMPYKGDEVTMTIVLPDEIEGLSELEDHLDDVLVTPKYVSDKIHVVLPKFKTEAKIKFNTILQSLGIVDAFKSSADFTGITASREPLIITKVIQKAFIEVDEDGTTAAAATAVIAGLGSSPDQPKEFIADHPFIYYLKSPAGILFIGRYMEPYPEK